MTKKVLKFCSILLAVVFFIVGCSANVASSGNTQRAVLVTDSGGVNDKSFNQGTNEGIMAHAQAHPDLWVASQAIESKGPQDYGPNLSNAADENDLVIAAGFLIQKDLLEAARANPETKFVGIDIDISNVANPPSNLQTYYFAEEQSGYLAGVAAALQTKTNKVGYLGGEEVPAVQKFGWGFVAGAQAVNPAIEVSYEYTGNFNDVALGTQKAQAMYNTGVDVIFLAAGGTGTGAISEAVTQRQAGKDVWVIGVDRDQYADGIIPGTEQSVILTSAVKKVDQVAQRALQSVTDGTFAGGQTVKLSAKDGALGIPETNPNLSETILARIAEVEQAIKEGTVVPPGTKEELDAGRVNGARINGRY